MASSTDIEEKFKSIIEEAEGKLVRALLDHYDQLVSSLDEELQTIQSDEEGVSASQEYQEGCDEEHVERTVRTDANLKTLKDTLSRTGASKLARLKAPQEQPTRRQLQSRDKGTKPPPPLRRPTTTSLPKTSQKSHVSSISPTERCSPKDLGARLKDKPPLKPPLYQIYLSSRIGVLSPM
jgi:hypothetical protein